MKTTTKKKLLAILMLVGASTQSALALPSIGAAGPFNCLSSSRGAFSFQLDNVPEAYDSAEYNGSATDLHGMGVAMRSEPVKILASPILTRTIVGFNYSLTLPSGAAVVLTNITYAPQGYENQLGMKGHAKLPNGQVVGVVCHGLSQTASTSPLVNQFSRDSNDDICSKPSCPLRLCGRCG